MSNRPVKKKQVVEITQEDFDVEWTPPPRTARDRLIQFGVIFLILAFLLPAITCAVVQPPAADPDAEQNQQAQQDEVEEGIQRFSKELAEKPNDPAVLANLGYYTNMKAARTMPGEDGDNTARMTLLATAEKYLRDSLAQDSEYGFAQSELAKNLLLQDKREEASTLIASGLEDVEGDLGSEDEKTANDAKGRKVELLKMSASMDIQDGNEQAALEKMNQVLELKPGDPSLYLARADIHKAMGNKDAAREDLNTVVNIGQQMGNQQAVMIGQFMIEQLDAPAPTATPGAATAPATPAAAAPATPAPVATP